MGYASCVTRCVVYDVVLLYLVPITMVYQYNTFLCISSRLSYIKDARGLFPINYDKKAPPVACDITKGSKGKYSNYVFW